MKYGKFYVDAMAGSEINETYCVVYDKDPNDNDSAAVEISNFTIHADEEKVYGSANAAIQAHMRRYYPDNKPVDKSTYQKLDYQKVTLLKEMEELIVDLLGQNGGRITSYPDHDGKCWSEFTVTMLFAGKHSTLKIDITDVYLDSRGNLMVDGIDQRTGGKEEGFRPYNEQIIGVFDFIAGAFGL